MELLCPDPAVTFACFLICLHSGLGHPMVTMSKLAGPQANGLFTTFPGGQTGMVSAKPPSLYFQIEDTVCAFSRGIAKKSVCTIQSKPDKA